MKKLVLSTIAAALVATTASADIKVGVGVDVMTSYAPLAIGSGDQVGSSPVVRIAVDGLVKGLRAELRYGTMSWTNGTDTATTTSSMTIMGLGAYYDIAGPIAVGGFVDSASSVTSDVADTETTLSMGIVLKAEAEIAKNFTIASEVGFVSNNTSDSAATTVVSKSLLPTTSVTFRYFF